MIYTVTCNPAVDYRMTVTSPRWGGVHRAAGTSDSFGGKGLNVSDTVTRLGGETVALGFAAGWTGDALVQSLCEAGIKAELVRLQDPHAMTRINVKLVDNGMCTEINAPGCPVTRVDIEALEVQLRQATAGDMVVLAGSLSPGMPTDWYGYMIDALQKRGVSVAADCDGEALTHAVKAKPFLVKPNREELSAWAGNPLTTHAEVAQAAHRMQAAGAARVLVSLGRDGALLADADGGLYRVSAPSGKVVQTVGAGDAMLGGFLWGYDHSGGNVTEALLWGTAAAGGVVFYGTDVTKDHIQQIYQRGSVKIETIDL